MIKDVKLNFIIDTATELFLSKGIFNVTVKDVALAVGVGEATIYRYFGKKQNIVISSATKLANRVFGEYFDISKEKTGWEKLNRFYCGFLKIFDEHADFYRFVADFDAAIAEEHHDTDDYEKVIQNYYAVFSKAYSEGLADGSVRETRDLEIFYLSTTHAVVGLCKKLCSNERFLKQDKYGREEVERLIEVITSSLKNLRV